ncbi:MAG: beta-Ala-His dipeptidase [Deltaproteobacteria bacterium]|nr:beta-Ala-His dipeptidase [Deltaproteobacteria bacterium]
METILKGLEPQAFWRHFYRISQIPRCSGGEEKVREYVMKQASRLGLHHRMDQAGNLVVLKPPVGPAKDSPVVVLQSHLDMVCEKEPGLAFDFKTDPIEWMREGNWLKAKGTTLGADNGVGVAVSLALMETADHPHGPLECLFTVGEETGLIGAQGISPDLISGRILINLDCEDIRTFYIGSAGSRSTFINLVPEWEEAPPGLLGIKLIVEGLKGGHSGLDIHRGRANAIKLLGRGLHAIRYGDATEFRLGAIQGGFSLNAIPRRAEAEGGIPVSGLESIKRAVSAITEILQTEYQQAEPDLGIRIETGGALDGKKVFTLNFEEKLINLIMTIPQGAVSWDPQNPEMVTTSTNLGAIGMSGERLTLGTKQRSFVDSEMEALSDTVRACATLAGGETETGVGYPGWKPRPDSPLLQRAKKIYSRVFGREPTVASIHAGLECGVLCSKFKGLDAISLGATIRNAHSPEESLEITSVLELWSFLTSLLRDLGE